MAIYRARPQHALYAVGSSFLLDGVPRTWYPTMYFGLDYAPAEALALWQELTSIEGILETQEIRHDSELHRVIVRCVICDMPVSVTLAVDSIGACALEFHQVLYSYLRGRTNADQQSTMLFNRRNRHPPIYDPRSARRTWGDGMEYRCAK